MANQKIPEKHIFVEPRNRLIGWVRKQLIGPPDPPKNEGPDLVGVLPTERFPCGALYPISPAGEGIDPAGDDGSEDDTLPNAAGENQRRASSCAALHTAIITRVLVLYKRRRYWLSGALQRDSI